MNSILKNRLDEEDITDLLEMFLVHHTLVNKVPPESLGWTKRQLFNVHRNKVNDLKMRLDIK